MAKNREKDVNKLVDIIFNFGHVIREESMGHECINPISIIRFRTLFFIGHRGMVTMKDVATHLGVTAPTATAVINRLVKDNLVARSTDVQDRRLVHLKITTDGKTKSHDILSGIKKKLNTIFEDLSDSEIENFITIIEKISNNFHKKVCTKRM